MGGASGNIDGDDAGTIRRRISITHGVNEHAGECVSIAHGTPEHRVPHVSIGAACQARIDGSGGGIRAIVRDPI